ncbi:glycosyltransferase [Floccifex sp.]|uniref:glycosyltransferase n=1 Tax=Floccifex sp. TaxID=2815810 RepID=UPI003F0EA693
MRILHYSLGFPPYRSGGLTKFCVDLMAEQSKEGHTVAMLWPGQIGIINKKTVIKNQGEVSLGNQSILSFEIINPLPVSFDEGIANIYAFTVDTDKRPYDMLLNTFKPNIIHIHTLMGLHKSFLMAAKERNIRLVLSVHDFFPICPKVTMFRHESVCNSVQTCEGCGVCNTTALSLKKIEILQSPLYRKMKESMLVKRLRKQHRDNYLNESTANDFAHPVGTAKDYKRLRNYYGSLIKLMDVIHYNSTLTKQIYESVFESPNSNIINITHADIKNHRSIKCFSDDLIRIRYLGPMGRAKGFFLLKEALDKLSSNQQNFCLDVHFTPPEKSPYIKVHERYTYQDLKKIFQETDVLVCPSILYETFGFTVLEALSYGVPVIISNNVGAKDILVSGAGIVVDDITPDKLCDTFQNLTAKELTKMNKTIVEKQNIMQVEEMAEQIEKICYKR